jgi:hypothetical protein
MSGQRNSRHPTAGRFFPKKSAFIRVRPCPPFLWQDPTPGLTFILPTGENLSVAHRKGWSLDFFRPASRQSQRDWNLSAQGCEERATLGPLSEIQRTLKGFNPRGRCCQRWNPFRVRHSCGTRTQGGGCFATRNPGLNACNPVGIASCAAPKCPNSSLRRDARAPQSNCMDTA